MKLAPLLQAAGERTGPHDSRAIDAPRRPPLASGHEFRALRERVRARAVVLGTFIKSAAHDIGEVLGRAALDFAIIDAEHAPFDLAAIDHRAPVVLGCSRPAGLPCLVRPPSLAAAFIGQCLDLGAAGILAPHVSTAEKAAGVVAAAKYASGQRGFSPSTRAGGYGQDGDYLAGADQASCVWCQIEDAEAIERLDAIAVLDEVDCLFLGRADLALSLGAAGPADPRLLAAVRATAEAGARHGRAVGVYIGDTAEIPDLLALGITVFACGSDHGWLIASGRRCRAELDKALVGRRR